jgi:hypothetical protein
MKNVPAPMVKATAKPVETAVPATSGAGVASGLKLKTD